MTIKKRQILDVHIEKLAFGGLGVTRVDGFTIFVAQAAPGDHARILITRKKKSHAEARILELLRPSPIRIQPQCRYSGFCGGCKWLFIPYEKQLEYKRQHVIEALEHIGQITGTTVHPAIPSLNMVGYRNKMEFSCSDRRWLLPDELGRPEIDIRFALGLHVPGTFHKVLDIDTCLLHPSMGNQILDDVRKYMIESIEPVYGLKSHTGFWRFLVLRHSVAYNQWMVNIVTAHLNREAVQPLADLLVKKYPEIVSVMNNVTSRKAGVAVGEYEIGLSGSPAIREKLGAYEFEISANSFFQTNTLGAETLYGVVKKFAEVTGNETVLDLYCGTGTIAIYLSDSVKQVTGIEIVKSSVEDATKNCQKNHVSNCKFILGDLMNCLPGIGEKPDILILDPPRSGMHKKVVKQIMDMGPRRIVYVSCNPATLARDLGMMKEQYRPLEIQPVDMFPHTYHIEAVARLEKISG